MNEMHERAWRGVVEMGHGAGGRMMAALIEEMFITALGNAALDGQEDQALLDLPPGRLALSTDGYVVSPLFFAGGDIGHLAVNGTINDVAMAGAAPHALTLSFILEEGFALSDLARIVASIAEASRAAGVPVVTGDTKVVERGKADGVFITTAGVGVRRAGVDISARYARPGDAILVSGTMGDHGATIMALRAGIGVEADIASDSAALHTLVAALLDKVPELHCLRDPTRGGLAAVLNEIAAASNVGMRIAEEAIPLHPGVAGLCELLGLDPLYVANEGKLVAILPPHHAEAALAALRAHPLGREAAIIGTVTEGPPGMVEMTTGFGGTRTVDWIAGEQLPRIC